MGLFNGIKFPYLNTQELNLDWIMTRIKELMGFMPEDGNVGDILMRNADGASWEPPTAVQIDIDGLPEDTQIMDNDQLVFYDISVQANRKIKPPNLLDSMCSNAYPFMNGTAAPGTSKKPARYDHVHPTDTSRAPANYFQNDALKIAHGGTEGTTLAEAQANLQIGEHLYKHDVTATTEATFKTNLTNLIGSESLGDLVSVEFNAGEFSPTLSPFYGTYYTGFVCISTTARAWGLVGSTFGDTVRLNCHDGTWTFTSM